MNPQTRRVSRLALALSAAALATSAAWAATGSSDTETQYRQQVERCNSGQTNQDKATCLQEAGAARDEARRGALGDASPNYERNAVARCDALPASDRAACVARMQQGTTRGSVEGGGVIREYREITTGTPAAPASPVSPVTPVSPASPATR